MNSILLVLLFSAVAVSCGGRGDAERSGRTQQTVAARPAGPASYTYTVKAVYPHRTDAYTQGLYWQDGRLVESTGQYGLSSLRRVNLATGESEQRVELPKNLFGEGAAEVDGRIYQLTWMEGKALVYDAATLDKVDEMGYSGEGWGLTTDGRKLYMSDGTDVIRVVNPADFRVERTIRVTRGRRPQNMLNELEWVDGAIWANVYLTDTVVIIDPESGRVTAEIDFGGLLQRSDYGPGTDVLNGIAWDRENGRIFVTGKNWGKLFEVEIRER
ncbi:MAG: glutaminyl-peptide cyclotransferase [Rikenellaceae bacterium]|nr:glutaminyl-peptide cyclotransferase [Rikenellaceae bacterium]